jgi:hypothetical protein
MKMRIKNDINYTKIDILSKKLIVVRKKKTKIEENKRLLFL